MTDLNLDGLPALQSVADGTLSPLDPEDVMLEIRQLVERERIEQARGDLAEINRAAERLPAWAKPVMNAADRVNERGDDLDYCDLEGACDNLTEEQRAQFKEIGEDDG